MCVWRAWCMYCTYNKRYGLWSHVLLTLFLFDLFRDECRVYWNSFHYSWRYIVYHDPQIVLIFTNAKRTAHIRHQSIWWSAFDMGFANIFANFPWFACANFLGAKRKLINMENINQWKSLVATRYKEHTSTYIATHDSKVSSLFSLAILTNYFNHFNASDWGMLIWVDV